MEQGIPKARNQMLASHVTWEGTILKPVLVLRGCACCVATGRGTTKLDRSNATFVRWADTMAVLGL